MSIRTHQLWITMFALIALASISAFSTLCTYELMAAKRDYRPLSPAVARALDTHPESYAWGVTRGDDGPGHVDVLDRQAWCIEQAEWWMHQGQAQHAPGEGDDVGSRLAFSEGCRVGWKSITGPDSQASG